MPAGATNPSANLVAADIIIKYSLKKHKRKRDFVGGKGPGQKNEKYPLTKSAFGDRISKRSGEPQPGRGKRGRFPRGFRQKSKRNLKKLLTRRFACGRINESSGKRNGRRKMNMGVFPSGQWGQTVNLLLNASVVRIHPRPPDPEYQVLGIFCCPGPSGLGRGVPPGKKGAPPQISNPKSFAGPRKPPGHPGGQGPGLSQIKTHRQSGPCGRDFAGAFSCKASGIDTAPGYGLYRSSGWNAIECYGM